MPKLPDNIRPSYLPPKPKQSGRRFKNKWYNTTRWRKLRAVKLSESPLCIICDKEGVITLANVVDHISNVSSGDSPAQMEQMMWDYNNLQSVCDSCHNKKSGKEAHQRK